MIKVTTFIWILGVRVLTEILKPKCDCVSNRATLKLKFGDPDVAEGCASTLVKLRHFNIFLRNRVAERCGDILCDKFGSNIKRSLLFAERVIVTFKQNGLLKLVIA